MRALVIACLAAALLPLLPRHTGATRSRGAARDWPAPFQGMRFQQDGREWLVRWIRDASRSVHPAEECYRATGWRVRPLPEQRSPGSGAGLLGRRLQWGCFEARRGSDTVEVCQTFVDDSGRSWSDAGGWWWSATLGKSEGPWLDVVRVTTMRDGR